MARGDAGCGTATAGRASERMRITLFVMAPRRPRAAGGRCSITLAYPGTGVEFLEFYACDLRYRPIPRVLEYGPVEETSRILPLSL